MENRQPAKLPLFDFVGRPPTFRRTTSYTSSASTSDSSTYLSSPPTSSPSLDGNESIPEEKDRQRPLYPVTELKRWRLRDDAATLSVPPPAVIPAPDEPKPESSALGITIIGTGFAGLSTAIACARQGFDVTVLERSILRTYFGDSIVLGSNCTRTLHKWGIGEEMRKKSTQGKWWIIYDKDGKELYREDLQLLAEMYGAPLLQGKRSHFTGVLSQEAIRLGVKFKYNAEVTGYSDSQDKPAVMLRGGELLRSDVVVVCDGAKSSARTLMASKDSTPFRRKGSGYSINRAIICSKSIQNDPRCSHLVDGSIRIYLGDNAHAEIWPLGVGDQVAFTFTHLDLDRSATLDWKTTTSLSTIDLTDWTPVLQAAVEHFPIAHNWMILQDDVEPGWVSKGGKIVFAGDAVHPLSPASFQGATQAIEDGATIALCLVLAGGTSKGVPIALKAYERLRRERAEEAGALGRLQQHVLHTFATRPQSETTQDATPLRPLNFEMYDFDAEDFARENWDKVVDQLKAEALVASPATGGYTSRYFAETVG